MRLIDADELKKRIETRAFDSHDITKAVLHRWIDELAASPPQAEASQPDYKQKWEELRRHAEDQISLDKAWLLVEMDYLAPAPPQAVKPETVGCEDCGRPYPPSPEASEPDYKGAWERLRRMATPSSVAVTDEFSDGYRHAIDWVSHVMGQLLPAPAPPQAVKPDRPPMLLAATVRPFAPITDWNWYVWNADEWVLIPSDIYTCDGSEFVGVDEAASDPAALEIWRRERSPISDPADETKE